ncbi:hypothetical protein [Longitalea arenae]|uniref:hypothetical protein n=1 Tax=Longitalea arenae TaxID=2812558 RepID=UPI00196713AE|nr:hypothetical protein [Longitalea arenae]
MTNLLGNILYTLVANGFHVSKIDRLAHNNTIFHIYKYDRLGAKVTYTLLLTEDTTEGIVVETLLAQSQIHYSTPVIINDYFVSSKCKTYTKAVFFDFFGGIMNTGLILVPGLPEIMDKLGHNSLPDGLIGRPHDLHEVYVKESFQFIMESPTRRYGIDRSFESLPDGVVLARQGFMLLLDSKAFAEGFEFTADDIRRFERYVNDFRYRYSNFFGQIFSFVVISGHFKDSQKAIAGRSKELYNLCNCTLSCIQSNVLGRIIRLLLSHPVEKSSIDWKNVFNNSMIDVKDVEKELSRIKKDKIH